MILKPNLRQILSLSRRVKSTQTPAVLKTTGVELAEKNEAKDQLVQRQPELEDYGASLYPGELNWINERQVRISKPSKNVMQSGTAYTNSWKIEFDNKGRWESWLMGWTSSADPLSNFALTFPTKESAIAYCEKNKLQWFVEEQQERKTRRKSYADNFSWNKRTRLGNK